MPAMEDSEGTSLVSRGAKFLESITSKVKGDGRGQKGKLKQPETRAERLKLTKNLGFFSVCRSGLIGVIATAIPILLVYNVVLHYFPELDPDLQDLAGWNNFFFLGSIIIASLIATLLELVVLYYDYVRVATKMNYITSRQIEADTEVNSAIRNALPSGLTKAALGLVRDSSEKYGINPLAETTKAGAAAMGAAFRVNILIFNALARRILRRIIARLLGRTAPRAFVEWLLLPVYVFWNMIGTTRVMNELIKRANGPDAVQEILRQIEFGEMDDEFKDQIRTVITSHVHCAKTFHPNIEFTLISLKLANHEQKSFDFIPQNIPEPQQLRLAKLIMALPLLQGKKILVDKEIYSWVRDVTDRKTRKTWRTECRGFIRKGIPFNSQD